MSPAAFPFERRVALWAAETARALTGQTAPFVLTLRADGSTRALSFEHPPTSWIAHTHTLEEKGEPYLFYDPLDGEGRAFIAWAGVERRTLERLLGTALTDADFVSGAPGERQDYPVAWDAVLDRPDG